jgi:RNA-directed DNA polymerase
MSNILSLNKLAFTLGISRKVLEDVSTNKNRYYRPYTKKELKLDGTIKLRVIDNPSKAIRQLQKIINRKILRKAVNKLPEYMTGSIKNRSIKHNAIPHVSQPAILAIDISNCFPSINSSMVYSLFRKQFSCSPPVAKVLTKLTTYGSRLPQGAPTSPSICNLILAPMALELFELSTANNIRFSQYVDDLTFSGPTESLTLIRPLVFKIVKNHGFKVNVSKHKIHKSHQRMAITGLVVNKGLSVGRKYIREVQRDVLRKRPSSIVNGKIAFIQLINKRRARKIKAKSINR